MTLHIPQDARTRRTHRREAPRLATRAARALVLMAIMALPVSAQDIEAITSAPLFTLTGGVSASGEAYASSGIDDRQQPTTGLITVSLVPTFKSFSMPVTLVLSGQEQSLSRQQFNIIGLSPQYGWATAHLGHRTMNFSRYTLAGRRFYGAGLDLKPGGFRLGAMYGRFQEAVERDSTNRLAIPAYEQFGQAVQIGYDKGSFRAMLSWVHAKDDTTSLTTQLEESHRTPRENNAVGLDVRIPILPKLLSFDADGGVSVLTRDLRASKDAVAGLDVPEFVNDLQTVNASTQLSIAGRLGLNLNFPDWGLRLGYERVEPTYSSLGAFFFNTDNEQITIAPRVRLGSVSLSGSIGLANDNVLGQKLVQTNRVIGSFNGDWQANSQFGLNASYSNYSTGQTASRAQVNDSIEVRSVMQSATISPRLMLAGDSATHSIFLLGSYQEYTDLNAFTGALSDNSSLSGSLGYTVGFVGSGITLGASLSTSSTTFATGGSDVIGVNVNGGISLLEGNTLSLAGSVGLSRVSGSGVVTQSGTVLSETLAASYRITDADVVTLSNWATQAGSGGRNNGAFSELGARLGYSRQFNIVNAE